ncbi:hypothetical protein ACHAQA_002066 [Verticillium albo-atrum]
MKSFVVLTTLATLGAVSAQGTDCPAPGSTNAAGDYSCNPAHQYPEGQECALVDGCYFLRETKNPYTPPAQPSATGCPAPGSTSTTGDYSCNPAHQYPEGQECVLVDGCYILHEKAVTTAAPQPTGTSCAAPGTTNAAGGYSCNPAHQYPEGQECVLIDGCYILQEKGATTAAPQPTGTSCPAPGSTSAAGDYSCNPAHQYPEGQECVLIDGCYFLRGTGLPTSHPNGTVPATGTGPVTLPTDHVTAGAGQLSASHLSAFAGLMAAGFYLLV